MTLQQILDGAEKEFNYKIINYTKDDGFVVNIEELGRDFDTDLIKSFLISLITKTWNEAIDSAIEVLPRKIYVNGLRKYNKEVPEVNSYNEAVVEAINNINTLKK